jgi:hypothetical protein
MTPWMPVTTMNLLFLIALACVVAGFALPKLFGLMGRRR